MIAECEAQLGGLGPRDQREPKVKAIQSGGRPGRVNAAAEATAAEPGLEPADPDPAAGAIAPNRSEVNDAARSGLARGRGRPGDSRG